MQPCVTAVTGCGSQKRPDLQDRSPAHGLDSRGLDRGRVVCSYRGLDQVEREGGEPYPTAPDIDSTGSSVRLTARPVPQVSQRL